MAITAGTSIGRYEIRRMIGKGGMGEVYLAEDTELERSVALKILSTSVANDPARLQGLVLEAKAASALNHPNILTIHEIGSVEHARFIVMEYVDGETLRKRLDRSSMNINEVLEIAIQIASALSAAHEAAIVHRDIKPQNIMIRHDRQVKVVDFGLAKLVQRRVPPSDPEAPTQLYDNNGRSKIAGAPYYMSPEQICGHEVDARTDIWSLGVVIYEMVTGTVPFNGASPNEVIARVLEREPVSLSKKVPDAPEELEWIIAKTLSKDPEERYQLTRDLLIDLKRLKKKLDRNSEIKRNLSSEMKVFAFDNGSGQESPVKPGDGRKKATEGMARQDGAEGPEYSPSEFRHYKWMALANFGLLLVTLAAMSYMFYLDRYDETTVDTIAVLPFVNASTDAETEYLADGICESLINSLSRLDQLRVVARGTAFRYKGRDIDPAQAGRELKVRAVLTGRVKQVGDDLNIQADLVDTATGAQLWGEEYQRKSPELMTVKQDIVREITEKLRLRLTGEDQRQLVKTDTIDPESYKLYLRGRYYLNRRDPESLKKAIDDFNGAIARDPNYALAYIGLADGFILSSEFNFGDSPATEVYPKARAAIAKALVIDDSLAEAHTSLAYIQSHYEWNKPAAEEEFQRAIALDPRYATAHHWYARHLIAMKRFPEAAAEIKLAHDLDPLSPIIISTMGDPFYYQRQYDKAIEQNKKALELDPNFRRAHFQLLLAYQATGRIENAIAERERLGAAPEVVDALKTAFARKGKAGYWQKLTEIVETEAASRTAISDHDEILLRCYLAAGNHDRAFAILERMLVQRFEGLIFLTVDPVFDPLRPDPRFADLLRRIESSTR